MDDEDVLFLFLPAFESSNSSNSSSNNGDSRRPWAAILGPIGPLLLRTNGHLHAHSCRCLRGPLGHLADLPPPLPSPLLLMASMASLAPVAAMAAMAALVSVAPLAFPAPPAPPPPVAFPAPVAPVALSVFAIKGNPPPPPPPPPPPSGNKRDPLGDPKKGKSSTLATRPGPEPWRLWVRRFHHSRTRSGLVGNTNAEAKAAPSPCIKTTQA